jgi:hypothetical protein
MKLHAEYQAIEIISGFLRPIRSASQPEAVAPTSRIHRVRVKTAVTAVSGTLNSCEIGSMISRKIVKSKASSVQPSQAADQASHWSLVGSLHHGIGFRVSTAAMAPSRSIRLPYWSLAGSVWQGCVNVLSFFNLFVRAAMPDRDECR